MQFGTSSAGAVLLLLTATLTGGCTHEMSSQRLASTVGRPQDSHFFGDRVLYMGDKGGYRYVHVRDVFDTLTFLGEREYRVPESDWPMTRPMAYTCDPSYWQDVKWMDGDAPRGVPQNPFLYLSPTFPEGAPATQPSPPPPANSPESFPPLPGDTQPSTTQPATTQS